MGGRSLRTRVRTIGLLFLIVIGSGFLPNPSFGFRYQDATQGHDFILVGVGALRQNLTQIDGPEIDFEESDEGLPRGYSNRSYLYLTGSGTLYHDVHFDLKTYYDEENPDEKFKFLLNATRNQDYLVLGDHERGLFKETVFTSMDNYIRGLTVHGERRRFGATVMGGVLRGETQVDEFRGDGTSGPYRLDEQPVLEGTETVKIETRDRVNSSRVLKSVLAVRGRDYRISYFDGKITFSKPVDEQDFRGNPVFIVVTYQFDSIDGRWQRATGGTRLTFAPTPNLRVGATYLADAPWNEGFSDAEWQQRRQIYGSDVLFKLGNRYHVSAEFARSEIPLVGSDTTANGVRVRLDTHPTQQLRVFGRYWRVEEGFLTFGNRDLASESFTDDIATSQNFEFRSSHLELDLDPNINSIQSTDQEALGLSGTYDLGAFNSVSAGYRQSRDNLADNVDLPVNTERIAFAAYKSVRPDTTQWLVGVDATERYDDRDQAQSDQESQRFIGALRQPLGSYSGVGALAGQVAYQFENIDDLATPDNSLRAHDLLGRLEAFPLDRLMVYGEQAAQWIYEPARSMLTRRTDITMLGVDGRINRFFEVDGSARFKRIDDLSGNGPDASEETYTLRWNSHPVKPVKFDLRAEYRLFEEDPLGRADEKSVFGGRLYWDIHANLRGQVRYEYEINSIATDGQSADETVSDDLYLRLDYRLAERFSCYAAYRLEHDEIAADPLPATRARTTSVLLGTHYQINPRFDLTAAYRQKSISEAVEDDRLKYFAELGIKLNRYFKLALGYEHFTYTTEDDRGQYDADVAYFSLVVKL